MRRSLLWLLSFILLSSVSCEDSDPTPSVDAPATTPISTAAPSSERTSSQAGARPMMIGFTGDYCLPCQVMKPWLAELRREHARAVDVVVVNLDREKNQRFRSLAGSGTVPTQVFVGPSGRVEKRQAGLLTREQMTATFRNLGWVR